MCQLTIHISTKSVQRSGDYRMGEGWGSYSVQTSLLTKGSWAPHQGSCLPFPNNRKSLAAILVYTSLSLSDCLKCRRLHFSRSHFVYIVDLVCVVRVTGVWEAYSTTAGCATRSSTLVNRAGTFSHADHPQNLDQIKICIFIFSGLFIFKFVREIF